MGLADDHGLGGVSEALGASDSFGAGIFEQELKRQGRQRVARDQGGSDTELRPHRGVVTPFEISVDDVVVDEREVVNQLNGDGSDETGLFVGTRGAD